MMSRSVHISARAFGLALLAGAVAAQAPAPPPPRIPYGAPIALDAAKRVAAAAEAEAAKNGWAMAIAVVDSGGHTVVFHRMDDTQLGSIRLAEGKARTALEFRRPSRFMQDAVAGGGAGLWWLNVEGVIALDGGVPVVVDGRIVGAIGVSGGSAAQDGQTAQAGAAAAARPGP